MSTRCELVFPDCELGSPVVSWSPDLLTVSTGGLLFLHQTFPDVPNYFGDLRSAWCCGRETASQQHGRPHHNSARERITTVTVTAYSVVADQGDVIAKYVRLLRQRTTHGHCQVQFELRHDTSIKLTHLINFPSLLAQRTPGEDHHASGRRAGTVVEHGAHLVNRHGLAPI